MHKSIPAALAAAAMLPLALAPANAADSYGTWISGEVSVEVQNDQTFKSSDGSGGNDLYTTVEFLGRLHFTQALRLELGLTLEPVLDREPGEDRWFGDHGIYADTLQLVYETGDWFLQAGKFTPSFGIDQDNIPGIYGDTFAASYELVERLGFGAGIELSVEDVVDFELRAAAFKRDTSVFGESLITGRPRLRVSDGGAGNTEATESVALSLDATNFDIAPALAVRASVLRQAVDGGDAQWGFSLGGLYEAKLGDITVTPFIDWVHSRGAIGFDAPEAVSGATETVVTSGVQAAWDDWFGAVVGGLRWDQLPGEADTRDSFVQVSVGYQIITDLSVEVGWLYLDEGGVETQAVGAMVAYGFKF